jgi:hypothetical protein
MRNSARWLSSISAVLTVCLIAASSASAAYEQVGTFAGTPGALHPNSLQPGHYGESWPEEVQLGGAAGGMAVNYTGAGGVPPGTVYSVGHYFFESYPRVVRFVPDPEPEPEAGKPTLDFSEAWSVDKHSIPIERCGPGGDPLQPHCRSNPGATVSSSGIAVDQATGDVYVNLTDPGAGEDAVSVYSADGSELITEFGESAGPPGQTIAQSPTKVHELGTRSLTVDDLGNVYLYDEDGAFNPEGPQHRLMKFEPQAPGDYQHYVYSGQSHDVSSAAGTTRRPTEPVADAAGHVYVAGHEYIEEFDPARSNEVPVCEFAEPKAGIKGITVNPLSGEVFFYDYHDLKIHQLAACNAEGKFVESGAFRFAPPRDETSALQAMAIDPTRQFGPGRPAGILYAASPGGSGGLSEASGELVESALGYVFAPSTELAPLVESESVSRVTATTAGLGAQINPKGSETRYAFQYLSDLEYQENDPSDRFAGAQEVPVGGGRLGSGQAALSARAALSGLTPDVTYHYRAIATSHCAAADAEKVCEARGADQTFRTFPMQAPGLPDGRAYELVSPSDKNGGEVIPAYPNRSSCGKAGIAEIELLCKPGFRSVAFPLQSSPDGEAIVFKGQAFSFSGGSAYENEYLSRRSESGWQTTTLSPPLQELRNGYKAFDTSLSEGLLTQQRPTLSPAAPDGYQNAYRQPTAAPGILQALLEARPPSRGPDEFELRYAGASADLSRVFFESNDALTGATPFAPAAVDGGPNHANLYEWADGQLRLVNVAPGNGETAANAAFGSRASGSGRQVLSNAISADGARVFWEDESGQVYLREDAERTKAIATEGTPDHASFLAAAVDGSRVLLASGHLHELDGAGSMTDLSQGKGGFEGLMGQSDDLSQLYFVMGPSDGGGDLTVGSATVTGVQTTTGTFNVGQAVEGAGVPAGATITAVGSETLQISAPATASGNDVTLTSQALLTGGEENGQGEKAQVGGFNLYAWNEGTTTYVTTLPAAGKVAPQDDTEAADWEAASPFRSAEASPDGRWLTFLSQASLTGYDNTGPCKLISSGTHTYAPGPCLEVYLYDAATGGLFCASCNPSGQQPLGRSFLPSIEDGGLLPQPRYLADSGRLYFDSRDSLSPFDTNTGAEDVYQYEPDGVGSCSREGGCVDLISAGHEAGDSNFLAMDPAGKNVFFTTRDQLTLKDQDELFDLYDAREGGGIAAETETNGGGCQGESCQAPISQPNDPTPSSSSFEGAGNITGSKAGHCPKGKVARKGRCVKKHKPKKHKKGHPSRANHGHGGAK